MEWHSQFGFGFFCSIYWWWDSSILLHLSLVCYFELLSSIMFNSFWSTMRTKSWASMKAQLVKNPLTMQGTPIWRSAGEGIGYPLQYSGLENFMDCIVHGVAKSWTWLSNFHFHFQSIHLPRKRAGFSPCVGKIPWRREQLPTLVFWPGKFHGLYSPWGRKWNCLAALYSIHFEARWGLSLKIDLDCRKIVGYFWIEEKIMGEGKECRKNGRMIIVLRRVLK